MDLQNFHTLILFKVQRFLKINYGCNYYALGPIEIQTATPKTLKGNANYHSSEEQLVVDTYIQGSHNSK